ncbi:hypothetical protein ENSA5_65610 [Enhygromyxa salina]|uniref:Uncharacterized protein n=1 Tax=Enhygromyxa salina TaxID=215803 RepID=A0A2S9XBS2_9BACT|nr:hypothetical protein [Enhygromyxa salina]PRP90314.1 hypothetical protein ENSA5_65610 [Enhygromyxa salina]
MQAPEPDADAHRAPAEPRALTAVEVSVRAYARAFPYLIWRYGDRGLGLIRSDNTHFMALAERDADELDRQVRWTADHLSERGMPRWMLELDLLLLARASARALPQRPDIAARLTQTAAELTRQRRASIPEPAFRRCATSFADALGLGPSRLWFGFGSILAAAVADERSGLAHAVPRVHEWAADRRRFGPRWIAAVDQTLVRAHRL